MSREAFDVAIVGAGPAGLSAAAHARRCGLRYLLLERSRQLADTIHCYQRGKYVMAEPSLVPTRSELPFAAGSRESVLQAWQEFTDEQGIEVGYGQEVVELAKPDQSFVLRTAAGSEYEAAHVILAVGTQGNPNRLGVVGEDLPHVKSRLVDPRDHRDQDIVVIGAGDSALEIANALSDENRVSLIVRRAEIVRAKEANEREALLRNAGGQLKIFFSTATERIEPGTIHLRGPDQDFQVQADHVYVKIGAQPPRRWLEAIGVRFSSTERDARPLLDRYFESQSVPGLYLIGAVAGRDLIKLGINQGYEVVERICGRDVLPADEEILLEKLPFGSGTVGERIELLMATVPLFARTEPEQLQSILLTVDVRLSAILEAPSTSDLREALLSTECRTFADGEQIVGQNDYTDSVYVIVDGEVQVRRHDEHGTPQDLGRLGRGAFFGELGLISGRRRSSTVVASGTTLLIEIPRKTMLKLIATSRRVERLIDETFLVRALGHYLFPNVPTDYLRALAKTAEEKRYDRGATVFREGEEGDGLYLVRSGQVSLAKESGGEERVLSYLVSGNFFGDDSLVEDVRREVTVTAIFPSALIRLPRSDFESFVRAFPEVEPRFRETFERRRLDLLSAEAKPGQHQILEDLIRGEVVIGTDALIIDDFLCVRCGNCVAACEGVHDDGQARLSLTGLHFASILAPNSCWQCENPLCMLDCPPDALVRDSRGEIYIRDNCIGCGNCETNCPYGNIFMVHPKRRRGLFGWLEDLVRRGADGGEEKGRTVAVKCDLCRDLGGGPACVRSCPTGAAIRLNPEQFEETIAGIIERGGTRL